MLKLHTRRTTYALLIFAILGLEAFFGWRAGEFYAFLFKPVASSATLIIVTVAVSVFLTIFGFVLSTHFRYALESMLERATKAAQSTAKSVKAPTTPKRAWTPRLCIGAAIALVIAHDVAGAAYLVYVANTPSQALFIIAMIGMCSLVALPFLVGPFTLALAESLPKERQEEFLAEALRGAWSLKLTQWNMYVNQQLKGYRKDKERVGDTIVQDITALLDHTEETPQTKALKALFQNVQLGAAPVVQTPVIVTPAQTVQKPAQPALPAPVTKSKTDALQEAFSGKLAAPISLDAALEKLGIQAEMDEDDLEGFCEEHNIPLSGKKEKFLDPKSMTQLALALREAGILQAEVEPVPPPAPVVDHPSSGRKTGKEGSATHQSRPFRAGQGQGQDKTGTAF